MNRNPVRRLRRGAITVELVSDSSQMVMRCTIHHTSDIVPVGRDGLGAAMLEFFRAHRTCSTGAAFDLEYG